jgi:hypothetical protein
LTGQEWVALEVKIRVSGGDKYSTPKTTSEGAMLIVTIILLVLAFPVIFNVAMLGAVLWTVTFPARRSSWTFLSLRVSELYRGHSVAAQRFRALEREEMTRRGIPLCVPNFVGRKLIWASRTMQSVLAWYD